MILKEDDEVVVETILPDDPHLIAKCAVVMGRLRGVPDNEVMQHPATIKTTVYYNGLVAKPSLIDDARDHVYKHCKEYVRNYNEAKARGLIP